VPPKSRGRPIPAVGDQFPPAATEIRRGSGRVTGSRKYTRRRGALATGLWRATGSWRVGSWSGRRGAGAGDGGKRATGATDRVGSWSGRRGPQTDPGQIEDLARRRRLARDDPDGRIEAGQRQIEAGQRRIEHGIQQQRRIEGGRRGSRTRQRRRPGAAAEDRGERRRRLRGGANL
jgi:hypothetical protein